MPRGVKSEGTWTHGHPWNDGFHVLTDSMADFLRRLNEPGADPISRVRSKPGALTGSVHKTATSRNSVVCVRRHVTLVPARLQLFSRRYYVLVSPIGARVYACSVDAGRPASANAVLQPDQMTPPEQHIHATVIDRALGRSGLRMRLGRQRSAARKKTADK